MAFSERAQADPAPLLQARHPLFEIGQGPVSDASQSSLFAGRAAGGLFSGWAGAGALPLPGMSSPQARQVAARLRDLIAEAEAGPAGYDAVQGGARIKPPQAPTAMTLADIDQWIRDTPGQPHAIGRYQFIPKTLRWLIKRLDLPPQTRFTPALQDRLADVLLADAGLEETILGEMSRATFKLNLARTWAGLPLRTGLSYYDGVAGNKATLTWSHFETRIAHILS